MIQRIAAALGLVMMLSGCYVDSMDERPPAAPGLNLAENGQPYRGGECRFRGLSRGCLDAYIVVNDITVGDDLFFNADEFANQFHKLINVERQGENLVEGETFQLNLMGGIGNKSFANGFEYYISGDALLDGRISKNYFAINSLREGAYDIRIEKKLTFEVVYSEKTVDEDGNETEEEQRDLYCASIYADSQFEIGRSQRSKLSFKEYKLHISNKVCGQGKNVSSISIP